MTTWIDPSGSQQQRLSAAIQSLYDPNSFQNFLLFRVEKKIPHPPGKPFDHHVPDVIGKAKMEIWLDDLLVALLEDRGGHPEIVALHTELNIGGTSIDTVEARAGLQRFHQGVGHFIQPEVFRTQLAAAERTICRISVDDSVFGTGFLVAEDLLLTNYHVLEDVIDGPNSTDDVSCLFDYKVHANGNTMNGGNHVALHGDAFVSFAKYSASDSQFSAEPPDTPADELDYAVLRLAQPVGSQPVPNHHGDIQAADGGEPRGWITLTKNQSPAAESAMFILQHPAGGTQKLAYDANAVMKLNGTNTRFRHKVSTERGASGAPCFDARWRCVGIHHGADPIENHPSQYNQGIPMQAICDHLDTNGAWPLS